MIVYWQDRDGNFAPPNAIFHCHPFFPEKKSPFSPFQKQIHELPLPQSIKVLKRTNLPDQREWIANVQKALSQNQEKVVLARCQILELERTPDPFAITAQLKKEIENSYLFCFHDGKNAFLGASPERLFQRQDNTLYSEAMAGTRPLGLAFEKDLLQSEKDLRELNPIKNFLQMAIGPCTFEPVTTFKTKNVQHLYSQCKAALHHTDDNAILKRIHPTPALCGYPQTQAFNLIRSLEPFDRGLYGGALGWSTPESSEYAVGIRCCYLHGNIAYLYAGTGIVQGSDPEKEWEELNLKTKLFENVFV